jgi:hypothetical protein
MRYLLYLAKDGDGMSLVLVPDGQARPSGDAQLIRTFSSRQRALKAMEDLRQEFVLPVQRCLARAEA